MTAKTPATAPVEDIDFDAFEDVLITTVVLRNPITGNPTSSTVDIMGPEHPQRKALVLEHQRRNRAEYQRTGKVAVKDPLEDIEADTEMLVTCTAGWNLKSGGVPIECSPENARTIYTDPKRAWLRAQVRAAMAEADRFISASVKS